MTSTVDLQGLAIDRGDAGQPKVHMRRHLWTRYVLPSVLILGFVSLLTWASWDVLFPAKGVTVMPVISTTAEVQREGTPLFQAAGWIEPRPTPLRVAALAPGVLEKLLVVEDQPVEAGQPIAELVDDDAKLTFQRALADLSLRESELEDAHAQLKAAELRLSHPVHLEAGLREAEAELAEVETLLKNLPFQLHRAIADRDAAQQSYDGKVASRGVVAGVTVDIAKGKLESAKALVSELRGREASLKKQQAALSARRNALQTQLDLLVEEKKAVAAATARVNAARALLEQANVAFAEANLRLNRMTITAPTDGRIFRLVAHPGTRIGGAASHGRGSDGSTVVTMYQPHKLQVRADVRFKDIPKVSVNQPVEIDNPALSSPLLGKVLFVSSEADIQKNTLEVKVAIVDPPPVVKPEMLVDATFLAPEQPDRREEPSQQVRLYVPQQLIQQEKNGSFVWVADQSKGVARRVSVQTADRRSGGLVEITSGLNATNRLIVGDIEGLQDGQRIRVTGEDTSLSPTNREGNARRESSSPSRTTKGGGP